MRIWDHEDWSRIVLAVSGLLILLLGRELFVGEPGLRVLLIIEILSLGPLAWAAWGRNRAAGVILPALVFVIEVDLLLDLEPPKLYIAVLAALLLIVPFLISLRQNLSWHRTIDRGLKPSWLGPLATLCLLGSLGLATANIYLSRFHTFGLRDEHSLPSWHRSALAENQTLPLGEPVLGYLPRNWLGPERGFVLYTNKRLLYGCPACDPKSLSVPLAEILEVSLERGSSRNRPSSLRLVLAGERHTLEIDPVGMADQRLYDGLRGTWERVRQESAPPKSDAPPDIQTQLLTGQLKPLSPQDRERLNAEKSKEKAKKP